MLKRAKYKDWSKWFAWIPIYMDDETVVIFQWVERKGEYLEHGEDIWSGPCWKWEYRYL